MRGGAGRAPPLGGAGNGLAGIESALPFVDRGSDRCVVEAIVSWTDMPDCIASCSSSRAYGSASVRLSVRCIARIIYALTRDAPTSDPVVRSPRGRASRRQSATYWI